MLKTPDTEAAAIETRVLDALRGHPELEPHSLAVTVSHDGITLAGAVANTAALVALTDRAQDAADGMPVMNMAVVSPLAVKENAARAKRLQEEIEQAIPDASIEVATMGTVVVLRGEASEDDRERAEFMAEHHPLFERAVCSVSASAR